MTKRSVSSHVFGSQLYIFKCFLILLKSSIIFIITKNNKSLCDSPFQKNTLMVLLAICCCICSFCSTEASSTLCSLDSMREFAMDACEHLFQFETEVRERRSLDYGFQRNRHYVPRQCKYEWNFDFRKSLPHINELTNKCVIIYLHKKSMHIY